MYIQGSFREAMRPIFLRVLVILSNQCMGLHFSPYNVFLKIHNFLGWLTGKPMGDLMMVVSLYRKVVLQK